ncbi:hypothetical protein FACS1894159_02200 [Bacteroidia bacterium]|nr:hypothetical protein FACS1894159_02200 [Bacteroidia bacterium]
MKNDDFNRRFLEILLERIPGKNDCAEILADLLQIDKASAYRRLSGKIKFNVAETANLAAQFGISLDSILDDIRNDRPATMRLEFWERYGALDEQVIRDSFDGFEAFVNNANSEIGVATDRLPFILAVHYEALSRFLFFKWGHYFTSLPEFRRFNTAVFPARSRPLYDRYAELYTQVKYSFCIWDDAIIPNLVRDIVYFKEMGMLTSEEVADIKADIQRLLLKLESLATTGYYPVTGNRFELYRSSLSIPGEHMYTSDDHALTYHLGAFVIRTMFTPHQTHTEEMKTSINSIKHGAILISGCAEKERLAFFDSQRRVVDSITP